MARLLVKATDNTHPDPVKDLRCYKRGDVVVVMPDGHEWGKEEGPPKFFTVDIPGAAPEKFSSLIQEKRDTLVHETNIPFEEFKDKPEYLAFQSNGKTFITETLHTARRTVSIDADVLTLKVKTSVLSGSAGQDVISATLNEVDLLSVQKVRTVSGVTAVDI